MKYLFRRVSVLSLGLVLSACGGSGSSGGNNGSPAANSNCTITTGFCGTLTGLPAGQTVTLYFETSDAGSGNLTLTANGPFTYGLNAAIDLSTTYGVGVVGETPETKCSVTNGGSNAYSGAIKLTVVSGVVVTCSAAKAYTVGGTLAGLNSGAQLPVGVDGPYSKTLTLTANGAFTFPTAVTSGDSYDVTVLIQPAGQNCIVSNGGGTVGANVSNVAIACSDVYTVGGTITGLYAPQVILKNNGADDLTLGSNGTFTFATPLAAGATYSVTIGTQPSHEHCAITGGGSGTVSGNVDTVQVECGYGKQVLYAFTGGNDGAEPQAGVIMDGAGSLYGTTEGGGGSAHCSGGCGTVFELARNTGGGYTESVLYSFTGYGGDGASPVSGVTMDSAGNLYGTTAYAGNNCTGGADGCGVVFKLAPKGAGGGYTESVLYAFSGGSDGSNPAGALLLDGAGNLYGTAPYGGSSSCTRGCGTVFELAPNGSGGYAESTVYSFLGGVGGNGPIGGLVADSAGDLYGMTAYGGSNGTGAVFELTRNGGGYTESILYSFPGTGTPPNSDATLIFPAGGLLRDSAGDLYGNSGTVFKLAPNGSGGYAESALFSSNSIGGLIMDGAGDFYGTIPEGGPAEGVIFELVPNGSGGYTELNLYLFPGSTYGSTPGPGLALDGAGNLYGTEPDGGNTQDCAGNGGCGDVFEISPR